MQVTNLLLAEYASQTEDGTFTLVGAGYNSLTVPQFPCVWPLMFIFIRFLSTKADAGKNKMEVRIVGEKGSIFKVDSIIEVDSDFRGHEDSVNLPLRIANIKFEVAGEYRVEVIVNGQELAGQTLTVRQLQSQEAGG